jgi:hypothetical protein
MAREVALISEPNVAVVLGQLPAGLRSVSGSGGCGVPLASCQC